VSTTATIQRTQAPALASAPSWINVSIIVTLSVILFWNIYREMASDWWNYDAYSQGMLLPPLALYVAWLSRTRVFAIPARIDLKGLWLSAAACSVYVLGELASEFFMSRISSVMLLAGIIWTFWGYQRLRSLGFPLLLLATMVPLPSIVYNSLAAPLQLFASDVAATIAQLSNVSVYRDGNILKLAEVTLGVAEACSGLNSLSALVVGSVLLGYLMCTEVWSRALLVACSVPIAIVVNVFRVAGTAILADYHREFAMGFYHSFSGWLVFLIGFGLLYLVAAALHALLDRRSLDVD
jgi:exosortase